MAYQEHNTTQDGTTAMIPAYHTTEAHRVSIGARNEVPAFSSREAGDLEPSTWFIQYNQQPGYVFNTQVVDVDPPFYQHRQQPSDMGHGSHGPLENPQPLVSGLDPSSNLGVAATSSSADEYRSVIDDLTVEIKRLREELSQYKKEPAPDLIRNEALFEVRFHGLTRRKKQELEDTLRQFAGRVPSSGGKSSGHTPGSSTRKSKGSKASHGVGSSSKNNWKHPDSAYASISVARASSRPGNSSTHRGRSRLPEAADDKVQCSLKGVSEGLFPRYQHLSEQEKRRLVVGKLEKIFTGKDCHSESTPEPHREAYIDAGVGNSKEGVSRHGGLEGDGEPGKHVDAASTTWPSKQRPTRLDDIDPDRNQHPVDNMQYIHHLGLSLPPNPAHNRFSSLDVAPDADGWVYLNLLCSMAHLHMLSVTPTFVRKAVMDYSTKFQVSKEGDKIRWRGGKEGTKFGSDGGGSSQKNDGGYSPVTSQNGSLKYQPIFQRHGSSSFASQGSEEAASSRSPGNTYSGWNYSGETSSRGHRATGSIVYYQGAPFCTDLSRNPVELSEEDEEGPTTTPSPDEECGPQRPAFEGPSPGEEMVMDIDDFGLDMFVWGDTAEPTQEPQDPQVQKLEAAGLGGVTPDDHFIVHVVTRRSVERDNILDSAQSTLREGSGSMRADRMMPHRHRLSTTPSSVPSSSLRPWPVNIEYLSHQVKTLQPSPLPPPVSFMPPCSSDSEGSTPGYVSSSELSEMSDIVPLRALRSIEPWDMVNPFPHGNPYRSDADLSSAGDDSAEEVRWNGEQNDTSFLATAGDKRRGGAVLRWVEGCL